MTAKEFYEKNKGLYFRYDGETVRVVGYDINGVIITYINGVKNLADSCLIFYIDSSLFTEHDRLFIVKPDELSEINPLNLCELLAGHEGEAFYSTIYGDVEIIEVYENWVYFNVGKTHRDAVDKLGRIYEKYPGECTLFPSKENRDWSTYKPKVVLPENSVVMVSNECVFIIRFYKNGNLCYCDGMNSKGTNSALTWKYIVPIADYDMNATFEENCKKSII